MEANGGMVAGSHKRNEFVMIRHEGETGVNISFSRQNFDFYLLLLKKIRSF